MKSENRYWVKYQVKDTTWKKNAPQTETKQSTNHTGERVKKTQQQEPQEKPPRQLFQLKCIITTTFVDCYFTGKNLQFRSLFYRLEFRFAIFNHFAGSVIGRIFFFDMFVFKSRYTIYNNF